MDDVVSVSMLSAGTAYIHVINKANFVRILVTSEMMCVQTV